MTYKDWIESYVSRQPDSFVRGKCAEATQLMAEAFPELRRVAGFVHCTWGRDQHWWCVAPDGSVVDPTKSQFRLVFEYEELNLADPETVKRIPTGKCPNCGNEVYEGASICGLRCEQEYIRYLNSV